MLNELNMSKQAAVFDSAKLFFELTRKLHQQISFKDECYFKYVGLWHPDEILPEIVFASETRSMEGSPSAQAVNGHVDSLMNDAK